MSLVLMDQGGYQILRALFDGGALDSTYEIFLFSNPTSLPDTLTDGSFTEISGGDYASKTITVNDCAVTQAGVPEAAWADQVWTFTGPLIGGASVKGYALIGIQTMTLYFAELLSTPFTPANNGDKLTIAPRFKIGNGNPA